LSSSDGGLPALISDLSDHRISVALTIELALVSTIREVMLKGAKDYEEIRLLAPRLLLAVLGSLRATERWMGRRWNGASESDDR
jgi:uncharacterized membrane protein (DUF373 family)